MTKAELVAQAQRHLRRAAAELENAMSSLQCVLEYDLAAEVDKHYLSLDGVRNRVAELRRALEE